MRRLRMRIETQVQAVLLFLPLCGAAVSAQSTLPATPAPYNPIALGEITGGPRTAVEAGQVSGRALSQNPYFGGVPSGKLGAAPLEISLDDAVSRGLKHNLGEVLATDTVTDARGLRWQALSELLPNVVTGSGFGVRQIDLKSEFGLAIPGVPPIIGPFGTFESRAYFEESVFDWGSIERVRSAEDQLESAQFSARDAQELVALVVISNYLLLIADESEVESARSQRDTAKTLVAQANDQKLSGLASAVDVLRSQVELQSREQQLISAKNALAKQKLVLARAIGLPLGQQFEASTRVPYRELTPGGLDHAIESAYGARPDYQSQLRLVRAAGLGRQAASAERYPSIEADVDYGLAGVNPGTSHGTIDAAVTLRIPVFQGGRVHGDVLRADAVLTQEQQRLEDLRARIDQEVRDAYLDLTSAAQEVSVEHSAVNLATQSLEQSRDRFRSGVTDNVEVVQAQDALAIANDAYIASLYSYNVAKISLARSIGVAASQYSNYLGVH